MPLCYFDLFHGGNTGSNPVSPTRSAPDYGQALFLLMLELPCTALWPNDPKSFGQANALFTYSQNLLVPPESTDLTLEFSGSRPPLGREEWPWCYQSATLGPV